MFLMCKQRCIIEKPVLFDFWYFWGEFCSKKTYTYKQLTITQIDSHLAFSAEMFVLISEYF